VAMPTKPTDGANLSVVSEFVFLGLTNSWEIQLLLFVLSSTFYVASMMGNSLIMLTKRYSAGSSKALSTLSAHITVVVLFFGPLIFFYTWPSPSTHLDKFLAFFDAVLTPFLNPIIYTFRNQEMKAAMRRVYRQLVNYRKTS
ncbi:hypothetical protein HPG69_002046, partial [Diceros bicornis minor]